MKKVVCSLLCLTLLFIITGCGKKCDDGYNVDGDYCVAEKENDSLLVKELVCDEDWKLEGEECVNGTMPKMGDGCEVGTTDRVGADGFCHHYKAPTVKYSCSNGALLKDNKCYEKKSMK